MIAKIVMGLVGALCIIGLLLMLIELFVSKPGYEDGEGFHDGNLPPQQNLKTGLLQFLTGCLENRSKPAMRYKTAGGGIHTRAATTVTTLHTLSTKPNTVEILDS